MLLFSSCYIQPTPDCLLIPLGLFGIAEVFLFHMHFKSFIVYRCPHLSHVAAKV